MSQSLIFFTGLYSQIFIAIAFIICRIANKSSISFLLIQLASCSSLTFANSIYFNVNSNKCGSTSWAVVVSEIQTYCNIKPSLGHYNLFLTSGCGFRCMEIYLAGPWTCPSYSIGFNVNRPSDLRILLHQLFYLLLDHHQRQVQAQQLLKRRSDSTEHSKILRDGI